MILTVAAYQGYALYNELGKSRTVISEAINWAEKNNVDVLCFPECFLQGYILENAKAREVSISLSADEPIDILKSMPSTDITVILGMIERDNGKIYNTAVVIENAKVIGKYRKHFIHNKETLFTAGTDFPVFLKKGIRYGVNICYDSRFPESAEALVRQGAQIIFCPLNNSLPHAIADDWKGRHIEYLKIKAKLSGCWIVSADVIESSETNTGYGCTCLVNPNGEVIEYLEHLKEGQLLSTVQINQ